MIAQPMTAPIPSAPRHPARFSTALIPILAELVGDSANVLDPFAGTGKLAEISAHGYRGAVYLNEIEEEWAELCRRPGVAAVTTCDARTLPYPDGYFAAVATSPVYGNRLADHHNAKDPSRRRSYTHDLGRPLTPGNAGALQWGDAYRDFHVAAWAEVRRLLRPGGRLVLNVSDHIRGGRVALVTAWHVAALAELDFRLAERVEVPTPRLRYGANADKRKAVTILLQDNEWSHWSDREIARRCNVTNHLVAELRQKLTGNSPSDATARTYITKHGTPAVMQTANIGGNGKAKTLPVGLAEPEDDGEDDSRLCPSCGEYAYLVHGGAGRYWWRCENCKCETGATYYENVAKIWSDTVAGKLPMHFYADESPEDDERLTVIDEWGSGETVTASYGSEITIAPLPTQTPIAVLPEMLMQVTVINADSSRYLADYVHGPVHLVVTSPPYNVGIEYDTYHDGSEVHAEMLAEVWRQCYDLLVEGGRIAVVVPFGVGRNPWTPVASEVMQQLIAAGNLEAMALLPARTDTRWARSLARFPRCYVAGRLRFSDCPNAAPFPSVIVYLGPDLQRFGLAAREMGDVHGPALLFAPGGDTPCQKLPTKTS